MLFILYEFKNIISDEYLIVKIWYIYKLVVFFIKNITFLVRLRVINKNFISFYLR